jgi:hypothetical protein
METTLIRAIETVSVLAAVLTLGAGLGGVIGYVAMYRRDRKHRKPAIHDRLHTDVDLHTVVSRAILDDRSDRSRKGWQTRREREARQAQQDADIRVLIGSDGGAR